MAKSNTLPSIENETKPTNVKASPPRNGVPQPIGDDVAVESETPVVPTEGYVSRRVDVKLNRAQAVKLRDKWRELEDSGAKLEDGSFVTNKRRVVQWLLENC